MIAYVALGLAVLGTAVLGVLRPLLTDEARGLLVHLAHYLVRSAARRLPPGAAERYEEEWKSHLHDEARDRPFSALLTAAHLRWKARSMIRSLEGGSGEPAPIEPAPIEPAKTPTPGIDPRDLELCMEMRAMCTCNQLRRATRGITALYEDAMATSTVNVTQLPILVGLGSEGDLSVTTLAGALALDRTTLTRNLMVFEKRGLIRIYENEDDLRLRMVSLTKEGLRVLSGALALWNEIQSVVEDHFGRDRLKNLYEELQALGDALDTAT